MTLLEIVIIILAVSYVCFIFGSSIYKRKNHLPTGECACCALKSKRFAKKVNRLRKKRLKKQTQ